MMNQTNDIQEGNENMTNYIDADNNFHGSTLVKIACMEYIVNSVTPVEEAIDSIKVFIADSKEFAPFDTASIAKAESQLAKFEAGISPHPALNI
tara:strand:+ start:2640 stop:2921 length:282 start_codon:yes stop_codon:yes gene_type:complete